MYHILQSDIAENRPFFERAVPAGFRKSSKPTTGSHHGDTALLPAK
jgi:hypothetical protein